MTSAFQFQDANTLLSVAIHSLSRSKACHLTCVLLLLTTCNRSALHCDSLHGHHHLSFILHPFLSRCLIVCGSRRASMLAYDSRRNSIARQREERKSVRENEHKEKSETRTTHSYDALDTYIGVASTRLPIDSLVTANVQRARRQSQSDSRSRSSTHSSSSALQDAFRCH